MGPIYGVAVTSPSNRSPNCSYASRTTALALARVGQVQAVDTARRWSAAADLTWDPGQEVAAAPCIASAVSSTERSRSATSGDWWATMSSSAWAVATKSSR